MTPKELERNRLRAVLRAMTMAERAAASKLIVARLLELPELAGARTVMLFAPLPSEPDIRPLLPAIIGRGGRVLVPRVRREAFVMTAHVISSWDDVRAGSLGFAEPDPDECAEAPAGEIDFILVPGIGFDRAGNRLGRGRGDYDRFLPSVPEAATRCGAFFAGQEAKELPREDHDHVLRIVVTERERIDARSPT